MEATENVESELACFHGGVEHVTLNATNSPQQRCTALSCGFDLNRAARCRTSHLTRQRQTERDPCNCTLRYLVRVV
jgi:hypothetical protein